MELLQLLTTIFALLISHKCISDYQLEPWFGSRYIEEDIPHSLMDLWRDPPDVDVSLHLPLTNDFIPCDFSIHADSPNNGPADTASPRCIVDEPLMKFWYKLDGTFKVPRANTYFCINLKGGYNDVKNCLLTELFIILLKDEMNELIYQVDCIVFVTEFFIHM
uniref:Insulin-degrading enzyme n=1 Tax=Rhizophora mucronata TaxID=61149 RepID=A0A2P2LZX1_RHIMU